MADLGRAALAVSLGLSVYALVAGIVAAPHATGAGSRSRRGTRSSRASASTLVAAAVLATALVRHDFSFVYVAQHTSRTLPTVYALTAFWGGQEGSLLLWLLVLTGYGTLAIAVNRRLLRDLVAWVVPVLGGIATFFAFVLVAVASPFDTQTAPVDGAGLTPSLQNPYMAIHPPMLYLGYVGLSIPFAFAIGRPALRAAPTSAGSSRPGAGRSRPGRSSASASSSARTGRTRRSAGAATTRGIRSRTPR